MLSVVEVRVVERAYAVHEDSHQMQLQPRLALKLFRVMTFLLPVWAAII